jgi:P4 family phage/plasmid primase-like protien
MICFSVTPKSKNLNGKEIPRMDDEIREVSKTEFEALKAEIIQSRLAAINQTNVIQFEPAPTQFNDCKGQIGKNPRIKEIPSRTTTLTRDQSESVVSAASLCDCERYFAERGLLQDFARANGVQWDRIPQATTIRDRLGEDLLVHGQPLSTLIQEMIWFEHRNHQGQLKSWLGRPIPAINNDTKFVCTVESVPYPYVPPAVWAIRKKTDHDIIFTDGPVKALVLHQAGANSIAVDSIWRGSGDNTEERRYPVGAEFQDFEWVGRIVYLAFDADQNIHTRLLRTVLRTAFLLRIRGAQIFQLTQWPLAEGKGIDDYLAKKAGCDSELQRKFLGALQQKAVPFLRTLQPFMLSAVEGELHKVEMSSAQRLQLCKELSVPLQARTGSLAEGRFCVAEQAQAEQDETREDQWEVEAACLADSEEQPDDATYSAIVQKFGPPFFDDRHGYRLNQPFFARLWGMKRQAFYDRTSEDYYNYNSENGCFERLRVDKVCGMIRDDIIAEALKRRHSDIAARLNVGLQRSIADLIKTDNAVCREDFFALDPSSAPVIHVGNGMLCFTEEGIQLLPFDPKYKSRNQIPISYEKQATCEKFLKKLLEPMMSAEDIDLLQRYAGLILIKGNRAQKILLLTGKGGAGKGTVLKVFIRVIGRKNVVQLRVSKLNERFEQARVIDKLLVHVAEATEDFLNQDGAEVVKSLCGHDSLDAERKHVHEPMAFEGRYPIIVVSNEQIRVRLAGDEEAWDRRLVIIICPNARPEGAEIIDNFDEVLVREEGEGILAWMIEGARKHWEELRNHKGFSTTSTQRERVKELLARSKAIETFVQTGILSDSKSNVTVSELYEAYARYCISKDWTPTTERKFEDASQHLILRHWGKPKSHSIERDNKPKRGYRGIALVGDSEPPDYEWH